MYFLYNAHGDVVQLTNSSGAVTKNYRYDAFGVEMNKAANDTNPWRYCGEYWDEETGTVYLRARSYDPRTGRFVSQDSWAYMDTGDPLSLNLYTYCHNNPVFYIDPSGNKIELSSDATEEEKQAYERAIEYLKTSEDGKKLIERLEKSKAVFTIVFIYEDDEKGDRYEYSTQEIYWDMYSGLILSDGKSIQSPALGLVHEMGHAAQHMDNELYTVIHSMTQAQYFDAIDQVEKANLEKYETPIAKQLGEFTRKNYDDVSGDYRLSNSTDYGTLKTVRSWYHYIWPGNWGQPRKVFENLNSWTP